MDVVEFVIVVAAEEGWRHASGGRWPTVQRIVAVRERVELVMVRFERKGMEHRHRRQKGLGSAV